jgi:hypothetical protein
MNHQQATDHKIPPVQKPMKRSFLHYALAGSITLLTGTALAEVIPVPETVSPQENRGDESPQRRLHPLG